MDIKELKKKIDEVIMHITISNMLLWFINEPNSANNFKRTFFVDIAGFIKKDGSGKVLSLHEAFDFCRGNPVFNIEYMRKVLMVEINWIFENLPYEYRQSYRASYKGKDKNIKKNFLKEFEFFRHIRDACAHNNRFNLKAHEPTKNLFDKAKNPHYEASWKNFKVDPKLDESELFFTFLECGDAIELLEFVRDNL